MNAHCHLMTNLEEIVSSWCAGKLSLLTGSVSPVSVFQQKHNNNNNSSDKLGKYFN